MECALYGPGGFYEVGRGAGRGGRDFITSPEVGELFGRIVGRRIDEIWDSWECPDPFFVVEAGAGRGRLAQSILNSKPRCADALRYVLVERSSEQRAQMNDRLVLDPPESVLAHDGEDLVSPGPGPRAIALDTLPRGLPNAVVLANELVDNLVFDVEEEVAGEWYEILIGTDGDRFVEVHTGPAVAPCASASASASTDGAPSASTAERLSTGTDDAPSANTDDAPSANTDDAPSANTDDQAPRRPVLVGWKRWMVDMQAVAPTLSLLLFDYGGTMSEIVDRSPNWLRTYTAQHEGGAYFERPGSQDVTTDVPFDLLAHDLEQSRFTQVSFASQTTWLADQGIDQDVKTANEQIPEHLDPGDIGQLRARSVVNEAAALTDPTGLGAFRVLEAVRR